MIRDGWISNYTLTGFVLGFLHTFTPNEKINRFFTETDDPEIYENPIYQDAF